MAKSMSRVRTSVGVSSQKNSAFQNKAGGEGRLNESIKKPFERVQLVKLISRAASLFGESSKVEVGGSSS